ncbi:MAG TPA: dihydroorotate dehydrogenase electron transfer subunit [candidate division Zixibacteria bacterium]
MRRHRLVTLLSTRRVGPNVFQQRFEDPLIARRARAGQFVHLLPGSEQLFRRAFSVYATDPDAETFDVLHQVYGEGTRLLSCLPRGASIDAIGPLGNRFTVPPRGHTPVLVGGGLGMAPLRLWAAELLDSGTSKRSAPPLLVLGARNRALCVTPYALPGLSRRTHWATDDGSRGIHGTAVSLLERLIAEQQIDAHAATVYGCGPEPMLRALATVCAGHGMPCQVSLERSMPCGFGVCMGCVVRARDTSGYDTFKRVCRDGPVFDSHAIIL